MTLSTDWGDDFLNDYASQINKLEARPGASPSYDKALEDHFSKVKDQVLASSHGGKNTGETGAGNGKDASSGKGGSASDPGAPTPDGSSDPGSNSAEDVYIRNIATIAGQDVADAVKKIIDSGSSDPKVRAAAARAAANAYAAEYYASGGEADPATLAKAAEGAAYAVENAAIAVAAAGGTPEQQEDAADTVAEAAEFGVNTAAAASAAATAPGGPDAQVKAAQAVTLTAKSVVARGFSVADADKAVNAVADVAMSSGADAATVAAHAALARAFDVKFDEGSVDDIAKDATRAGQAFEKGVEFIKNHGGGSEEIANFTTAMEQASDYGVSVVKSAEQAKENTITAGGSVADGVQAAQVAVDADNALREIPQGTYDMAAKVADAVASSAKVGGLAAARQTGKDVLDVLKKGSEAGLDKYQIYALAQAMDDAAASAGPGAASAAADTFKFMMDEGTGLKEDALRAAQFVAASAKQGGIEDAEAEAATFRNSFATPAGQALKQGVKFIKDHGGGSEDIATFTAAMEQASSYGPAVAKSVEQAVEATVSAGGSVADGVQAAQVVVDTVNALPKVLQGDDDTAAKVADAVVSSAKVGGLAAARQTGKDVVDVLVKGSEARLDKNQINELAQAMDDAAASGGPYAAEAVADTFESLIDRGVDNGYALQLAKSVATGAQNGGIEGAEAAAAKVGA